MPPIAPKDEPDEISPLLYEFLKDVRSIYNCDNYQIIPSITENGMNTYSDDAPRAWGMGWWGAFGHIVIDGTYTNILIKKFFNGYIINMNVNYNVDDTYEWFGEEGIDTPLPLGTPNWNFGYSLPVNMVKIPHEWEDSLDAAGKAREFFYSITWSKNMEIMTTNDFTYFYAVNENDKWLPLE